MSKTSVRPHLLQPLKILTQFAVDTVRQDVLVFAIDDVSLSVEEPGRDFVLGWVLHDGNDALQFLGREITSTGGTVLVFDGI